MPTFKFDHHQLESLGPEQKSIEYFDVITSGLGMRVSVKGTKSFFYRYRFHGRNKRYNIGSFPGISLKLARQRALELKVSVSNGVDPQLVKEKKKAPPPRVISFADIVEAYKQIYLPRLREATAREYERIIAKELMPLLRHKPVEKIERKELVHLLEAIGNHRGAKTLSNRVRAVLSSVYSFGVDTGRIQFNPVLTIKKTQKEVSRDRIYTKEELKTLWDAFEAQEEPISSYYKCLLILGQRAGETRRMKWEDIDLKKKIWAIPKEETKAARLHIVPLPKIASELLTHLKSISGDTYVFESSRKSGQPLRWTHKASARISEHSGVHDFKIHDLRRTMASGLAELGISRTVIGKVINHKGISGDSSVTAIYDRYDYLEQKREALENWSQSLALYVKSQLEFNHYRFNIRMK
jgi:integrase